MQEPILAILQYDRPLRGICVDKVSALTAEAASGFERNSWLSHRQ